MVAANSCLAPAFVAAVGVVVVVVVDGVAAAAAAVVVVDDGVVVAVAGSVGSEKKIMNLMIVIDLRSS